MLLPPALDDTSTADLVIDYRNQPTPHKRDQLILGHLRLGNSIVSRYAQRLPSERSEFVGLVNLAIVEAVDSFFNEPRDHNNIAGFITLRIHRVLSKRLSELPIVVIPGDTQRGRKHRGQDRIDPIRVIDVDVVTADAKAVRNNSRRLGAKVEDGLGRIDMNLQQAEVDEIINVVCTNDDEREVVRLRLEGYGDKLIGQMMNLSRWSIWAIRQGIQERFKSHVAD